MRSCFCLSLPWDHVSDQASGYTFINPRTISKTYWVILKTFYIGKKILLIPPLQINCKLESDFEKKANRFNEFYASKGTPHNSGCTLPHFLWNTPTVELSSFQFNNKDILKIIRAPHVNKAYGCDISVRMIKICHQWIVKPLPIIYQNCLNKGTFPGFQTLFLSIRKMTNKSSITTDQYLICMNAEKFLERLVFNSIFDFIDNDILLSAKN